MPPSNSKAPVAPKSSQGSTVDNFRQRRLSVADIDTSEFPDGNAGTPESKGRRDRRMSASPEMGVQLKSKSLPFPTDVVGTYSCHGVEPGTKPAETSAKINQDRGCTVYPFAPLNPKGWKIALFCVYDGHGAHGDKVSEFVMNSVVQNLEVHNKLTEHPPTALKEAFDATDSELRKNPKIDAELSGTTAVACLLIQDPKKPQVIQCYSACSGDSRAVYAYKTSAGEVKCIDLTEDQKPDTPDEKARILKKGGYVSPPEVDWGGPARVWLDESMTLPGLAMARSIGDHLVKSIGVIATPEVTFREFSLDKGAEEIPYMIIMASDGVWEFIDSMDAVKICDKFMMKNDPNKKEPVPDSTEGAIKLIEEAAHKWRHEEGDYRDDITAFVIRIRVGEGCLFDERES